MNRSLRLLMSFLGTFAAAALNYPVAAQQKIPDIDYYEVIDLRFELEGAREETALVADTATLEFYAFGRHFDAVLQRNRLLIRRLPPAQSQALADVAIWEGELQGLAGSWVRLTQQGEFVSGAIYDGRQTYRIERYEIASPRLVSQQPGLEDSTIIYIERGFPSIGADMLVGFDPSSIEIDPAKGTQSSAASFKPALASGLEVEIGAVGDVEFVARYRSSAAAEAISQINVADAIFIQQLGVHLTVAEVRMFQTEPDPFSSANGETALRELEAFKAGTAEFAPLDLTHLFTAKELDDRLVGIANLSAVCATRTGVSLSTDDRAVAHEIAHNLGAPHDTESGSRCQNEAPGYIMDPTFNSSVTFSACSLQAMRETVSSARCLSPLPATDIQLSVIRAPATVVGNAPFDVYFQAVGTGTEDMYAVEVTFEASGALITGVFPNFSSVQVNCQTGQTPVLCTTPRIPSGRSASFRVTLKPTQPGALSVSGSVWSLNDSDAANNHAEAIVDVEPTIDLTATEPVVSPKVAVPGQAISVSTVITNAGLIDASAVEIRIDEIPQFAEFVTADISTGGSCALQTSPNVWLCPVGRLGVGQQLPVRFELNALDPGTTGNVTSQGQLRFSFRGAELDIGPGGSSAPISVNTAIVDAAVSLVTRGTIAQGQRLRIDFTVDNHGPDPIDGASVELSFPGFEIDLGCQARCGVGPLMAGASTTFNVSGLLTGTGSFVGQATVQLTARDPNPANNTATLAYTIAAPQPSASSGGGSGGGGGGGAMSPAWLLLLAATWCWTRSGRFQLLKSCPSRRCRYSARMASSTFVPGLLPRLRRLAAA